ncbi:MAG: prolyl oligopeptidase family serine peptidase, partial [Chloroflexota bacterium]|nr:prolyl oligopeptidase family serine peptidase [Chloroflexota bacterium]
MNRNYWFAVGLSLLMTLLPRGVASAAGPPEYGPDPDEKRRVGLVSTRSNCLAVQGGALDRVSATVRLQWEGDIEEAFLVLTSVTGSQGGHSIYVNGQPVGSAPIRTGSPLCQTMPPGMTLGSTDMISIPIKALTKGENVITLTNDADVNDSWTVANLHIEIHGVLSGPPVAALETTPTTRPPLSLAATTAISDSVLLTSTYELARGQVVSQLVSYQIPTSYTESISVPLIIGIHGMGTSGEWARDFLAAEANDRGWLLAAPEMHGDYYINTGQYALAWPGAQHDIIDTIEFMMSEYKVDPSRIYIAGGSMGGQTSAMMTAKYPDVFAAAVPWKPLTDLTDWYGELDDLGNPYDNLPRIRDETGGTPSEVPFEYQRRSPMQAPQNSRLTPIKMWHDVDDQLVPIHHSRDLRNAINSWDPPTPAVLIEVPSGAINCPPDSEGDFEHCYNPPQADVFDFLSNFTLSTDSPISLTIRTDESKPYYWLNLAQTGGEHWSQVQASYDLTDTTATVTISDTHPLTVAFNLGTTPIMGRIVERAGMGLPATTYLVKGGSNNYLHNYTSGYLTTTLSTTGQFTLTISAVEAEVSANPATVSGWQTTTLTVTAKFQDHLNNPIPDGTIVHFFTSEGTFPNTSSIFTTTATGGQATTDLTLTPVANSAEITASVENITASTSVDVIYPAIDLLLTPNPATIYSGQTVTYTYRITNTGDTTLTNVTVVDDSGPVCAEATLAVGASETCSRSTTLDQDTTITATVTGQDPLSNDVTGS